MNLKMAAFFALTFVVSLMFSCNTEQPDCELSFGPPSLIFPEIDAWITSESNGDIQFQDRRGDSFIINLELEDRTSRDPSCGEIIQEINRFNYSLDDNYFIIAQEVEDVFSVRTQEYLNGTNNIDIRGNVNAQDSVALDAVLLDRFEINNEEYAELLLLIDSQNRWVMDSVFFQKGVGLVAFKYEGVQWVRL